MPVMGGLGRALAMVGALVLTGQSAAPLPARAQTLSQTYTDARDYCAAARDVDRPGPSWRGPQTPDWIRRALGVGPSVSVVWRCMGGAVLACTETNTSPCVKADTSRTPSAEAARWCRTRPNGPIHPSYAGRDSAYLWECRSGRPVIVRTLANPADLDARGFWKNAWTTVSPPRAAPASPTASAPAATRSYFRVPDACPFEGCQLGVWKARAAVQVYAALEGAPLRMLRAGDSVTALEAEVRTAPRKAVITRVWDTERRKGLRVGSTVDVLHPGGEGTFVIGFQGQVIPGIMESQLRFTPTLQARPLDWAWWVKVRLRGGQTGWLKNPQGRFDGMDSLS